MQQYNAESQSMQDQGAQMMQQGQSEVDQYDPNAEHAQQQSLVQEQASQNTLNSDFQQKANQMKQESLNVDPEKGFKKDDEDYKQQKSRFEGLANSSIDTKKN